MKGNVGSKEGAEPNASADWLAVAQLLTASQSDISQAAELSQAFEPLSFHLGDVLSDVGSDPSDKNTQSQSIKSDFYIICSGRVRLVVFDAERQQEVTALVLEAGDTFGADSLFCHHPLPYRAVAATAVAVARIEPGKLQQYLQRLPNLQNHLLSVVSKRQYLIFFKTLTDLRRCSSLQLEGLLPYLTPLRISAGEFLSVRTPAEKGRFWLVSGQISHQGENSQPLASGTRWGYPDSTPRDWVAATDLLVVSIPASIPASIPERVGGEFPGHQPPHYQFSHNPETGVPIQPPRVENPPSVDFPKPAIRRFLDFLARYPFLEQQSSSDCGAACLAMISQYWGKRFTLNYLRELAGVGRSGASLTGGLAKAAESLGFHAVPVRATLPKLEERHNPWIAHWEGVHYIVVYRCFGQRLLIADPAIGRRSISRQEFVAKWSGYALLLDPTDRLQEAESQKISLSRFASALAPYRSLIGQIIFASLLIQAFGVVTPLFTQIILDKVVVNKSLTTLNVFALGLVLFGVWSTGLTATRQYLLDYFSNRFDLTLIGGFISHTLTLPLKFFESRRVGDIITRVQENQKIQQFLTRQVVLAWLDMLMGAAYLGLMAYYNWQLTVLVLALIPPIAILTLVATPLLRRVSRDVFNEEASQNSLLVEMLTGVSTVKAAAAEREIRWRWEHQFTSALNARFRGQKLANFLQAAGGSINSLGSTALLWYGATLVIQDQLTIGQFVAFNMMISKVISPVLSVVNLWDQMQEVSISVERLNDVFEAQPEEIPGQPMLNLPRLRGEVRFENVTFSYSPQQERNTLQNISFTALPGQTIAIVGRSGSGKSTLVSMLQILYRPDSGRIQIDGHDIRLVSPQSLRSQMGVVPQECFLFSGTVLENITLYRPEFTLEQVTEVAKLAEAHAFIQDMPLGYNTKVGERGSMLSGGQRQRIAIARALLGDPRILVLDEATSSLDTESERRFQQNLERLSRDRTTFIIAHRLSTVRNADSILVLDRGILVEQGTHEELMKRRGLYCHLAQQQLDL
ncbi:MAG TPA: ATP-binding cassette domain-containing protein [Oscillatoriaceae cyanobacterium M33_DOE_052]|uniref:ATP-binding cassette domain-containing protein n=1 Tax=Planktothricoides sp. SpSt-374 TaxID=2282167 RepID=A0A7C3VK58_9CYAN|nr:ATP-binding cassette domain-containing protein [Oscillatoriaceae cyanobacterium M33_DOE_052]